MEVTADFATRRFTRVSVRGDTLDVSVDISEHILDYPNEMPFDQGSMIYIVGAMRSRDMMKEAGVPIVYFDDVEGGVLQPDGTHLPLLRNDFEKQDEVTVQPVTYPVIRLEKYRRNVWYQENENSLFSIQSVPFAKSGTRIGVADAGLKE